MPTLVWGHGVRDRGEEKTFVPDGSTVKWYADLNETLLTSNGFAAVSSGGFGSPSDSQGPGRGTEVEIYNYAVSQDLVKADFVALLNREGNPLMFIGTDIPQGHLCNDLEGCKGAGAHKCDGVLGKAKDTEIVVLVCRGLKGVKNNPTVLYGSDKSDPVSEITIDMVNYVKRWMTRLKADPVAGEQEFDGLPDASKIMLTTHKDIPTWQGVRWAADAGRTGKVTDVFPQLREVQGADNGQQFLDMARYADGIVAGAKADPIEFFTSMRNYRGALIEAIGKLPGLAISKKSYDDGVKGFDEATWSPDDKALKAVTDTNAVNVKASEDGGSLPVLVGGTLVLIGSGHSSRTVNYVERQGDFERGTLTVTKGGAFAKGGVQVTGVDGGKRALIEQVIKLFSKKEVTFA
jgi:hypothetical protein